MVEEREDNTTPLHRLKRAKIISENNMGKLGYQKELQSTLGYFHSQV